MFSGRSSLGGKKTRATIDGSALRWIERHRCFLAALRAGHCDFDALSDPGRLCGRDGCQALVLRLLAGFATFGLVGQAFVVKENLFACGPNEILAAIDALDGAILKLG